MSTFNTFGTHEDGQVFNVGRDQLSFCMLGTTVNYNLNFCMCCSAALTDSGPSDVKSSSEAAHGHKESTTAGAGAVPQEVLPFIRAPSPSPMALSAVWVLAPAPSPLDHAVQETRTQHTDMETSVLEELETYVILGMDGMDQPPYIHPPISSPEINTTGRVCKPSLWHGLWQKISPQ
ncbi:hypothetical protein HWV62_33685 [Athelia sp. TMB]|nr:hypothetical protein HWV62_33685 [Athelia sp. TMB]